MVDQYPLCFDQVRASLWKAAQRNALLLYSSSFSSLTNLVYLDRVRVHSVGSLVWILSLKWHIVM